MKPLHLILLLLMPYLGSAQAIPPQAAVQQETRLGVTILRDAGYSSPYQWSANLINTRLQRKLAANISLDRQLHPKLSSWRAIANFGYHRAQIETTAAELAELRTPTEVGFVANFKLDYFHLSSGLILEPFPERRSRPYLSGLVIITLPTQFRFDYSQPDMSLSGTPQTFQHRANISPSLGWQIEGGWHIDLNDKWGLAFGLHYTELVHTHNWIPIGGSFTPTEHTVLAINTVGGHIRWLYRW
ncbi:MAG: hypothetical protein AAFO03_12085 [Bacteroidota bacterium]